MCADSRVASARLWRVIDACDAAIPEQKPVVCWGTTIPEEHCRGIDVVVVIATILVWLGPSMSLLRCVIAFAVCILGLDFIGGPQEREREFRALRRDATKLLVRIEKTPPDQRDCMTREFSEIDRRACLLELTHAGHKKTRQAPPTHEGLEPPTT